MLHSIVTKEPVAAQLITWHNLWFMLNLLTESWMHHLDACSQRSQGPQFLIFVIQSFILSFCLTIVVCAVPQDLRSVRLRAWFIKKTQKSESHPNTDCQEMREAIKANTFHEPWYVLSPASFLLLSFFIRRASVCWKEVAWHLVGVRLPSFWKIQLASASLCQAVLKPFAWCSECNASVTGFIHGGFRGFTVSNTPFQSISFVSDIPDSAGLGATISEGFLPLSWSSTLSGVSTTVGERCTGGVRDTIRRPLRCS